MESEVMTFDEEAPRVVLVRSRKRGVTDTASVLQNISGKPGDGLDRNRRGFTWCHQPG